MLSKQIFSRYLYIYLKSKTNKCHVVKCTFSSPTQSNRTLNNKMCVSRFEPMTFFFERKNHLKQNIIFIIFEDFKYTWVNNLKGIARNNN